MSSQPKVAAFGTWKSPITADLLSAKGISLLEIGVNVRDGFFQLPEMAEMLNKELEVCGQDILRGREACRGWSCLHRGALRAWGQGRLTGGIQRADWYI